MQYYNDSDAIETQEWRDAFQSVIKNNEKDRAQFLLNVLYEMAVSDGVFLNGFNTPYINTISTEVEPAYLGDRAVETRIKQFTQYNLFVLLMRTNISSKKLSRKINSIASSMTLYETGLNHFFKAETETYGGDLIYYQSHILPLIYVRCYLEGLYTELQLTHVGRSMNEKDLSHDLPNVPSLYQFSIESMGITPIMSIYHASIQKYLINKGLLKEQNRKVWAFLTAKKINEPYSLGSIPIASKESLNNLIWVVECHIHQNNSSSRNNSKTLQNLESMFVASGWTVIKVLWGSRWDALITADRTGVLKQRLLEVSDREYQLYSNRNSDFIRQHFFGKYDDLAKIAESLSEGQIKELFNSDHDPLKVYSAYSRAIKNNHSPTVVLVKTVNDSNTMSEIKQEVSDLQLLKVVRSKLNIPLNDKQLASSPFFRPEPTSSESLYLQAMRQSLGGMKHDKKCKNLADVEFKKLNVPTIDMFAKILLGSTHEKQSLTVIFVKILSILLRENNINDYVVPIVFDEINSSGFEGMFRQYGVYASYQRTYTVTNNELSDYNRANNSHIMNESMNEAGAMSSWLALATSYITNKLPMIPIYLHCSIFGFQRIADLVLSSSNSHAKGFLISSVVDKESSNHDIFTKTSDNSQSFFGSMPNCVSYNPCYGYELAIIIHDGLHRMYAKNEKIYYYINLPKDSYEQPAIPANVEEGIKRGLYLLKNNSSHSVQLLGSGSTLVEVQKAAIILKEMFDIDSNVWSVTSFNELTKDGLQCDEHNRLKPLDEPKSSWLTQKLKEHHGIILAATDSLQSYAEQIRSWIPEERIYTTLGKDGFERNENAAQLNRKYNVDAVHIVVSALKKLADIGEINVLLVLKAINYFNLNCGEEHKTKPASAYSNMEKKFTGTSVSGSFVQFNQK